MAENVVIKDELEDKGAKLVEGSVTIADTAGFDIQFSIFSWRVWEKHDNIRKGIAMAVDG